MALGAPAAAAASPPAGVGAGSREEAVGAAGFRAGDQAAGFGDPVIAAARSGAGIVGATGFREVAVAGADDGFDAVAADPDDPLRLWAATGARVLGSEDGGHTWRERCRLPGTGRAAGGPDGGTGAPGAFGEPGDATVEGGGTAVDDLAASDPGEEEDEAGVDEPSSPGPAAGSTSTAPVVRREGARIRGLRVGRGGLWIAANDGVYRFSGTGSGASLERYAIPGGAAVLSVEADPLRPAAAWIATSAGLAQLDGGLVRRGTGAVGTTPARDVDAVPVGTRVAVAVASDAGLFLSADGGIAFAGPIPIGASGRAVAAVRLDPDGGGLAVTRDGGIARFDPTGRPLAASAAPGLRDVRRLHVSAGAGVRRSFIASGEGLWVVGPDGVATTVPLPTPDVRDVVAPAGRPDRPLVATGLGLFLAAGDGGRRAPPGSDGAGRPGAPGEGSVARLAGAAALHLGLPDLEVRGRLPWAPLLPHVDASWSERSVADGQNVWALVATWELARLVGPGDLAVSAAERRLHRARRALALRVERALRARDRLLAATAGARGPVEDALRWLAVEEQTARLDGLTGGRFSAGLAGDRRFP